MARDNPPGSSRQRSASPRRRSSRVRSKPSKIEIAWEPEGKDGQTPGPPVTKGEACCFYMKKKGFKYIAIILMAHVWAAIGGAIIMKIEEKNEAKQQMEEIEMQHNFSTALTNNISSYFRSEHNCWIEDTISTEGLIYSMIHEPVPENHYPWSYAGSVFYCITLITTIGYGNQIASTTGGQVFTILFSLIGVPLFLSALNAVASLLTPVIKFFWIRLRPCCCFVCNKMGRKRIEREETDGVLTTEDLDEMETFDVPIYVALFLFVAWSLIWAFLFTLVFKGWNFFKSFYFLFITNTTIGLGDIVPPNAYMGLIVFPLLLVSLALISMTISVFTDCIEDKIEDIIFEDLLGWDTDTSEEDEKKKAQGKTPTGHQGKGGVTLGIFQQKTRKTRETRQDSVDIYDDYDDDVYDKKHRRKRSAAERPQRSKYLRMKTKTNQTGGTYIKKLKRDWGMTLSAKGTLNWSPRRVFRRESLSPVESDSDYEHSDQGGFFQKLRRSMGLQKTGNKNKRSRSV